MKDSKVNKEQEHTKSMFNLHVVLSKKINNMLKIEKVRMNKRTIAEVAEFILEEEYKRWKEKNE